MLHPVQARHIDWTNKEIGRRALNPCRCSRKTHVRIRPAGSGDWISLGPPGGDVFDAAASTVDANIVLAGLAPGGSFGGTLYRSSDGGNTWSEVPGSGRHQCLRYRVCSRRHELHWHSGQCPEEHRRWSKLGNVEPWHWPQRPSIRCGASILRIPSNLWAGHRRCRSALNLSTSCARPMAARHGQIARPPHAPMSCRGIAVDPSDSNTVIAVFGGDFGGGQAWVTTDGGDSWTDRSAGLPGNPLQRSGL